MSRLDRARARNLMARRRATPSTRTVGMDPALRVDPASPTGYAGVRRHGNKRGADTKGQWRDSTGGTAGAWNRSAYGYWR